MKKVIVIVSVIFAACFAVATVLARIDYKMRHRRYVRANIKIS